MHRKAPTSNFWPGTWSDVELQQLHVTRGDPAGQARREGLAMYLSFVYWHKIIAEAQAPRGGRRRAGRLTRRTEVPSERRVSKRTHGGPVARKRADGAELARSSRLVGKKLNERRAQQKGAKTEFTIVSGRVRP